MGNGRAQNKYFDICASRDPKVRIPVGVTIPEVREGGAPVIVMVHGFLGSKDEWGFYYGASKDERKFDSIAERLYELGIGTIRFDMPGSGESKDDFRNYTLENCRSDLEDVYTCCMKAYKFDPGHVGFLCWSMGAKAGAGFLAQHSEIRNAIFLNPAGDNGGRSIMKAAEAGLDYQALKKSAEEHGEVLNKAATQVFGHEFYMSEDFFRQVEASVTGDEIRSYMDSGRKGLMIYGDCDSSIAPETYKWLRENTGVQHICIQGMGHDMGLESGRPDFTNTVIDLIAAYFHCYL